ncbi:DUF2303 family protein [Roseivivax isoporae]|uniref:DUF2303 family protein n=1 Tax=Roseivivax isoporae LMG 25204 TaxID=1449351 RepID=X7F3F5_9RHOB|nr:DUF2303 family protein [Roseivivax isoporae]ETX26621.1 hypothetical protein RISW2_21745 [Roseivivax isoporae LMG 25204]
METNTEGAENVVETTARLLRDREIGMRVALPDAITLRTPFLVDVPAHRRVEDHTKVLRDALLHDKPMRRTGTAKLTTLDSLIDWAVRFKSDASVLYARRSQSEPSLTCIANYHGAGPTSWDDSSGEVGAAFRDHRGVYEFPLSKEWKRWMKVSGQPLAKEELAAFIEDHATDFMDPTPNLLNKRPDNPAPWEERNLEIAEKISGRFGQTHQLMELAREFTVHETSNLVVKTNRDTGAAVVAFQNEHNDAEGRPLEIPNLFLIAIPVFESGDLYRLTLRFSYRKSGPKLVFFLTIYDPEKAFDDAFDEAVGKARTVTGLPLFMGAPE